ncbi:MAG: hypothetical protein OSB55_11065, partial [Verrucomicrobiota bacterium]|nr:hypothetical protein [Verrucomicrobiota bacterium]
SFNQGPVDFLLTTAEIVPVCPTSLPDALPCSQLSIPSNKDETAFFEKQPSCPCRHSHRDFGFHPRAGGVQPQDVGQVLLRPP